MILGVDMASVVKFYVSLRKIILEIMTKRKVFARFITDLTNNITYRRNTVLQFGDSWNVIGTAILLNPGSATISSEQPSAEDLLRLKGITGVDDGWQFVDYNRDATIRDWLPRLFNGYYANKERELKGVILLYNLFNLKEPNSEKAKHIYSKVSSEYIYTSASDIEFINKSPIVYIGWGKVLSPELMVQAQLLFDRLDRNVITHYSDVMGDNVFYHPRAIQLGYKRLEKVKDCINRFENALERANI